MLVLLAQFGGFYTKNDEGKLLRINRLKLPNYLFMFGLLVFLGIPAFGPTKYQRVYNPFEKNEDNIELATEIVENSGDFTKVRGYSTYALSRELTDHRQWYLSHHNNLDGRVGENELLSRAANLVSDYEYDEARNILANNDLSSLESYPEISFLKGILELLNEDQNYALALDYFANCDRESPSNPLYLYYKAFTLLKLHITSQDAQYETRQVVDSLLTLAHDQVQKLDAANVLEKDIAIKRAVNIHALGDGFSALNILEASFTKFTVEGNDDLKFHRIGESDAIIACQIGRYRQELFSNYEKSALYLEYANNFFKEGSNSRKYADEIILNQIDISRGLYKMQGSDKSKHLKDLFETASRGYDQFKTIDRSVAVKCKNALTGAYHLKEENEKALKNDLSILDETRSIPVLYAETHTNIAVSFWRLRFSNPHYVDSAKLYSDQAIQLFDNLIEKGLSHEEQLTSDLALQCMFYEGKDDFYKADSVRNLLIPRILSSPLTKPKGRKEVHIMLGIQNFYHMKYDSARSHYASVDTIIKSGKLAHTEIQAANFHYQLLALYNAMGEYSMANNEIKNVLVERTRDSVPEVEPWPYWRFLNLRRAETYMGIGKVAAAKQLLSNHPYNKDFLTNKKDSVNFVTLLYYQGRAALAGEDKPAAHEWFQKIVGDFPDYSSSAILARSHWFIADIQKDVDSETALSHLEIAITLYQQMGLVGKYEACLYLKESIVSSQ